MIMRLVILRLSSGVRSARKGWSRNQTQIVNSSLSKHTGEAKIDGNAPGFFTPK